MPGSGEGVEQAVLALRSRVDKLQPPVGRSRTDTEFSTHAAFSG